MGALETVHAALVVAASGGALGGGVPAGGSLVRGGGPVVSDLAPAADAAVAAVRVLLDGQDSGDDEGDLADEEGLGGEQTHHSDDQGQHGEDLQTQESEDWVQLLLDLATACNIKAKLG